MTPWRTHGFCVPADHASMSGHFPGRPIVPGALLLDEVAERIAGPAALRLRTVKFLQPVHHGEALELRWQMQAEGGCRFEIMRAGQIQPALTGMLEIGL
jgi:3-hydroxyacyl-[acyl-carrier-protein] dehydratase